MAGNERTMEEQLEIQEGLTKVKFVYELLIPIPTCLDGWSFTPQLCLPSLWHSFHIWDNLSLWSLTNDNGFTVSFLNISFALANE